MTLPLFDAATGNKVGSGTTNTWAHTVATGKSNQILLVSVDTGLGITSITYAGVALTELGQIAYNSGNETLSLWYLLAPATGTNNVIVTATGTTFIIGVSMSYYDVAQSSTFGTLASNSGTTGTASSNTVATTSTNQLVIDAINNGAASTDTPTASQTKRFQPSTSGVAEGDIAATGAAMTLSWSFSTGVWAELSVAMNVAASSAKHFLICDGYGGVFS